MANKLYEETNIQAIADAIRAKGVGGTMTVAQMASKVASIPSGGSATLITKSITANGTYAASADNADGYSSVTVNVSGGGGGLSPVFETTFDVAESTEVLTIEIPATLEVNAEDFWLAKFVFIDELPLSPSATNTGISSIDIHRSWSIYTDFYRAVARVISKTGAKSYSIYASKNTIYITNISSTKIKIEVKAANSSWDTARGTWKLSLYKLGNKILG